MEQLRFVTGRRLFGDGIYVPSIGRVLCDLNGEQVKQYFLLAKFLDLPSITVLLGKTIPQCSHTFMNAMLAELPVSFYACVLMLTARGGKRTAGVEPAPPAWHAGTLGPLSYVRVGGESG